MPKLRRSPRLAAKLHKKAIKVNPLAPPRRSARLAAKRRGKPNTAFIRHRPTVLDKLPMDVINYHIFTNLDYDSRINLNQCLPIWDRVPTKMPPQSIMKHDIDLRIKIIQNMLYIITHEAWDPSTSSMRTVLSGDAKIMEMTKMFKFLQKPQYFNIISLYPKFHNAIIEKIIEFEAVSIEEKKAYSEEVIDKFNLELNNLKKKIEKEKDFFSNAEPPLGTIKPLIFI